MDPIATFQVLLFVHFFGQNAPTCGFGLRCIVKRIIFSTKSKGLVQSFREGMTRKLLVTTGTGWQFEFVFSRFTSAAPFLWWRLLLLKIIQSYNHTSKRKLQSEILTSSAVAVFRDDFVALRCKKKWRPLDKSKSGLVITSVPPWAARSTWLLSLSGPQTTSALADFRNSEERLDICWPKSIPRSTCEAPRLLTFLAM